MSTFLRTELHRLDEIIYLLMHKIRHQTSKELCEVLILISTLQLWCFV